MVVGICSVVLHLPGNDSLKGKRHVVKPIISRLRKEFNLSVAEVDAQDSWQQAILGLACVSNDTGYVHGVLEHAVQWIEANRPDVELVDYQIEMC